MAAFTVKRKNVIYPRAMWCSYAMRQFTSDNSNKGFQNVFTQPSGRSQEEKQAADEMFEELKEEKVDDRESAAKNLSLSLLQTESPD